MDPIARLAAGACRVLRRECPDLNCRLIDVSGVTEPSRRRMELTRQLAAEMVTTEDEGEVILRGRERWVRRLLPLNWQFQSGGSPLLRQKGTYLVTGGLGGLGGALARYLAKNYKAQLVLIARRGSEPSHEDAGRKRLLRDLASMTDVLCVAADVTSEESMKSALDRAESRFGEINGVFHCAGEVHDGLLMTKSEAELKQVLDAKVNGTVVLDRLFAQTTVDFMLLYSSVSAWVGLPGQVDYAAANSFLDAVAERSAQSRAYPVLSIGWGAWRDVGMAARLVGHDKSEIAIGRHPLLQRALVGSDGTYEFYGVLEADTCWMLDGHRTLDGVALLPGTAYLELARAAVQAATAEAVVSIADFVLMAPLVVEGATEIRVQLNLNENDLSVGSRPILSGAAGEWVEHARGQMGVVQEMGARFEDLSLYRSACGRSRDYADGESATRQNQMIQFGERWSTLRHASFGDRMAVGELELPRDFTDDLEETALHPALLDVATSLVLPLVQGYDDSDAFYAPVAYNRVTVHRSLEPSVVCFVRCKDPADVDTIVFDLTIASPGGQVLVEIEECVMKRLPEGKLRVAQHRAVSSREITSVGEMDLKRIVSDGISTGDGMRVLECLLRVGCPPSVLVSPYDLTAWSRLLASDTVSDGALTGVETPPVEGTVRQARPNISTPLVLPTNETERRIAAIWKDSLGLAEIGIEDNFFELGGHSLGLVQVIMKSRKALKADIPVASPELMGRPTIRVMGQLAQRNVRDAHTPATPSIKRVSRELYRRTV